MESATVIISTTGAPALQRCVASVLTQSPTNVLAYVVVDGPKFAPAVALALKEFPAGRLRVLQLPENVGGDGYYGHRAYAGCSHFINTDFVMFLDEDNWLEPDHVSSLSDRIRSAQVDWAFSLCRIHSAEGQFIATDDCESLGAWPGWGNYNLVDTSSYRLKREVAVAMASAWHGGWRQDRVYFATLKQYFPKFATSGQYTLNYRLGGNPNSVKTKFVLQGNAVRQARHPAGFPWRSPNSRPINTPAAGVAVG